MEELYAGILVLCMERKCGVMAAPQVFETQELCTTYMDELAGSVLGNARRIDHKAYLVAARCVNLEETETHGTLENPLD